MNEFMVKFQRFIKNKNTVTIIGVVLAIGILYWGYNTQISKAVTPVKNIPVATNTIQPRTKITSEMISYVDVAPVVLSDNVIRYANQVIGKYSNYNTVIPQGSMFYNNTLVNEEELPDSAFTQVEDGEVVYNFPVDMDSTYGNSIFPGNQIDIYMKARNDAGQIMVGKLVENVKVLAVKDASGKHVFENSEEERVPATIIFGVSPEINILLRKASYMNDLEVELFPVPHGGTAAQEGETQVSTQYLKDFINANTVVIDEANDQKNNQDNNTNDNNQNDNAKDEGQS